MTSNEIRLLRERVQALIEALDHIKQDLQPLLPDADFPLKSRALICSFKQFERITLHETDKAYVTAQFTPAVYHFGCVNISYRLYSKLEKRDLAQFLQGQVVWSSDTDDFLQACEEVEQGFIQLMHTYTERPW